MVMNLKEQMFGTIISARKIHSIQSSIRGTDVETPKVRKNVPEEITVVTGRQALVGLCMYKV